MSIDNNAPRELLAEEWNLLEQIIRRFETAWQQGVPPLVDDFLPVEPVQRRAVLVELVHADLEYRLKSREHRLVEHYTERYPELAEATALIDLLGAEYRLRRRWQLEVSLDEYLDRFPHLSAELRPRLEAELQEASTLIPADGYSVLQARSTLPDAAEPLSIPGYKILEELGRGGMGVVHKAVQLRLNRVVAIKVILDTGDTRPVDRVRFLQEAETIAQLQHPNIVQLHECGTHLHRSYLVLEYVEGVNLAKKIGGSPQSPWVAARLVETLARAVHHAHQQGVVHRDLKPGNVLLTQEGMPKITDFGLAKRVLDDNALTQTGAIVGTPSYMAPEQAAANLKAIGPSTDVYSLGVILYELLTGQLPFRGATALETLEQVRSHDPVSPRRLQPKAPRDLEIICLKCLQKEQDKRYENAQDLADDLHRFLSNEPILARPVSLWERGLKWARRRPALVALLMVSLVAVLGLAGGLAWHLHTMRLQEIDHLSDIQEEVERLREKQQRKESEERQSRYDAEVRLAHHFWKSSEVARAQKKLADQMPREGEKDRRDFAWRHLWRRCQTLRWTSSRQGGEVTWMAISPSGLILATAGIDQPVQLWDLATGQLRSTLGDRKPAVKSLAMSPGGTFLATACSDGTIRVWDLGREELHQILQGHEGEVTSVAFSPDGGTLASAGKDRIIKLWEVASWKERLAVHGHKEDVFTVAFTPHGKQLASAGAEKTVRLWDPATGRLQAELEYGLVITRLTFSPDSRLVVPTDSQGNVRLWELPMKGREYFGRYNTPVHAVAFSPDGKILATGEEDGTVRLWDLEQRRERLVLRGHLDGITFLTFSAQGNTLASASRDGTIKVWDPTIQEGQRTLEVIRPTGPIAMNPSGEHLAVADRDGSIKLLDTTSFGVIKQFPTSFLSITALCYSPDGKRIAMGAQFGRVRLWDVASGTQYAMWVLGPNEITTLAFSPDGQLLAVGDTGGQVKLWEVETQKETSVDGHAGAIRTLAFAPAGKELASASEDGTVKRWDLTMAKEKHRLEFDHPLHALAYSPEGKMLALAGDSEVVTLWDTGNPESLQRLTLKRKPVHQLIFSADGRYLYLTDGADCFHVVDMRNRTLLQTGMDFDPTARIWLALSRDGNTLASCRSNGNLRLWNPVKKEARKPLSQLSRPVHDLVFAPDGKTLITASHGHAIKLRTHWNLLGKEGNHDYLVRGSPGDTIGLWDVGSGRQRGRLAGKEPRWSVSLALSADGQTLVAGSAGGTVWRWDLPSSRPHPSLFISEQARNYWDSVLPLIQNQLPVIPNYWDPVKICLSPDGKLLATVSQNSGIKLWQTATGKPLLTLPAREGQARCVAFSPDGTTLAAGVGAAVHLWDVGRQRWRSSPGRHQKAVLCLAFSPDGRTLASGGEDTWIKLWNLSEEQEEVVLPRHTGEVVSLAFSPDGMTLASGSWDGTVKLWNPHTGRELLPLEGPLAKVHVVAFSPDGGLLAAGGETAEGFGEIYLWDGKPAAQAP